jgi:Putative Flp pilus-assembly TadE/G-like
MSAPGVAGALPMRTLLRRLARDERGGVLPLVALCMTVILGFAALAIDLGQQTAMRTQLEATADAAALAAAAQLPDESKARKKALEYAEQNMPPEAHGHVLAEEDIVFGTWYAETRKFVVDGPVANAVQVTVRRGVQNGNPAPTFFLHIFGYDHADLAALSLAGNVLFSDSGDDGSGVLNEADLEKLAEMQEALKEEFARQGKLSPKNMDALMSDKEAAEFLMENYGHAVLLK